MRGLVLVLVSLCCLPAVGCGQWLKHPTEGVPQKRRRHAEPQSARAAPARWQARLLRHLARRKPQPVRAGHRAVHRVRHRDRRIAARRQPGHGICRAACRISRGRPSSRRNGTADDSRDDPHVRCLPDNPPRHWTLPHLTRAIHTPKLLALLYEVNAMYRQIHIDGRPLPADMNPSWMGYSTARWEGDTLVVQTEGFRDDLWLDTAGSAMTSAAKMTERIRRPDYGTLEIDLTIDDPEGLHEAVHREADAAHRARHRAGGRDLRRGRAVLRADDPVPREIEGGGQCEGRLQAIRPRRQSSARRVSPFQLNVTV